MAHTRKRKEKFKVLKGLRSFYKEIEDRDYKNIEGLKVEISEKDYDRMLNVLPPLKWEKGKFYSSEFLSGDLTTKFSRVGNKHYAEVVDFRKEFPKLKEKEYFEMRF
jgi:hypothetical protein